MILRLGTFSLIAVTLLNSTPISLNAQYSSERDSTYRHLLQVRDSLLEADRDTLAMETTFELYLHAFNNDAALARTHLDTLFDHQRAVGIAHAKAQYLKNLGDHAIRTGDYPGAVTQYKRTLVEGRRIGREGDGVVEDAVTNMALAYRLDEHLDSAERVLSSFLDTATYTAVWSEINARNNYAALLEQLGRNYESFQQVAKAAGLTKSSGDLEGYALTSVNLCSQVTSSGVLDIIYKYCREPIGRVDSIMPKWTPYLQAWLGSALVNLDRNEEAYPYLLTALNQDDNETARYSAARDLARVSAKSDQTDSTQFYLDLARQVVAASKGTTFDGHELSSVDVLDLYIADELAADEQVAYFGARAKRLIESEDY